MKSRSLNGLLLFGYSMVALPLIAAIIMTARFVDGLVAESDRVVALSVSAASGSRMLSEHITALERSARQYLIVGEPQLLTVYKERLANFSGLLDDLRKLDFESEDFSRDLQQIETIAWEIEKELESYRPPGAATSDLQTLFAELPLVTRRMGAHFGGFIDKELSLLQTQARDLRTILTWQALSVIPLTIIIAAVFATLIARPIRNLSMAVYQIGEGDLHKPIAVRGPQDLQALGWQLDWLRVRLMDLEKEKNDFISHVSHELKTPLANVREGTELLCDGSVGKASPEQNEVFDIIRNNTLNLQEKIENLLNFNAWQHANSQPQKKICDLRQIVNYVLDQHRLAMAKLGLECKLKVPAIRLHADYEKLHSMLDNLMSNAIKFSPPGGRIYLRAKQHHDGKRDIVRIDIADEGPGIQGDEQQKVFEPFYQGRQSSYGYVKGTGIGLAVVWQSVVSHDGTIKILQGEYPGAHFSIELPV